METQCDAVNTHVYRQSFKKKKKTKSDIDRYDSRSAAAVGLSEVTRGRRPMMPWLAGCCIVAMATFAAGSPQCSPTASLDCALQTAGVRDPAAMAKTLLRAELRTVES